MIRGHNQFSYLVLGRDLGRRVASLSMLSIYKIGVILPSTPSKARP